MKTSEALNHTAFFESLKSGAPKGIYLFSGTEEYVKRSAMAQLEAALSLGAYADMNRTVLKDPDAATLISAAETLPFMADRRLVVVRDSAMISGKARDYDEGDSAEQLKAYLPAHAETSVIVFYTRGDADKRKKLYQCLAKCAVLVQFDSLTPLELQKKIAAVCRKASLPIRTDAVEMLIYSVGNDLTALLAETEKLIAYCDGKAEIAVDDVRAVCTTRSEYKVFELAQTVLMGRYPQAFQLLRTMLADGEAPLMLLALLTRQCRQVYDVSLFLKARMAQPAMAGKLGIPSFAVRQLVPIAQRYTTEQLGRMVRLCTDLEFRVKSGQLPEEGVMEQAMLSILSLGGEAA